MLQILVDLGEDPSLGTFREHYQAILQAVRKSHGDDFAIACNKDNCCYCLLDCEAVYVTLRGYSVMWIEDLSMCINIGSQQLYVHKCNACTAPMHMQKSFHRSYMWHHEQKGAYGCRQWEETGTKGQEAKGRSYWRSITRHSCPSSQRRRSTHYSHTKKRTWEELETDWRESWQGMFCTHPAIIMASIYNAAPIILIGHLFN